MMCAEGRTIGEYRTRYGTIEFTHSSRTVAEIHAQTAYDAYDVHADMFIASPALAKEDIRRARPGMLHLIIDEYHQYALEEWEAAV